MVELRLCIDVDDMPRAVEFYVEALGLEVGRRFDGSWVELVGASCPIDLLEKAEGSTPSSKTADKRDYARHWTPVHFDVVVRDLGEAILRIERAGGRREGDVETHPYGRIAYFSDPFGNGFCVIQFAGLGYDALA